MLLEAYSPALQKSRGIFVPLIVTNCLILERSEAFASKKKSVHLLVMLASVPFIIAGVLSIAFTGFLGVILVLNPDSILKKTRGLPL
ncbi:Rnf-Nqr domain containing protein [Natranaerobius thermophilus]|uniref:SoxR-reducing system protein RsxE n=1 Tax=Natranaerobius thermophilus (strain ATCC BAA-1301 / DSM 18059 / JW/NM-WN-LF) TaxID=457570 RepID=B2A6W6_NATTJ|nr:SoxR-reducing system protein RsxE [Natranaerobius thermophilus JW/NM-WN-LF]